LGSLCCGWILGRYVLSIRGGISVAASWPFRRDSGSHARHGVGFRSLLCRHHGCEHEIPLYLSYRFFNCDHSVFDCGRMVINEANLKQPLSAREFPSRTTRGASVLSSRMSLFRSTSEGSSTSSLSARLFNE